MKRFQVLGGVNRMKVFSQYRVLRGCVLVVANLTALHMSYMPHRIPAALLDEADGDRNMRSAAEEAELADNTIAMVLAAAEASS